jgi:hypothetical protein
MPSRARGAFSTNSFSKTPCDQSQTLQLAHQSRLMSTRLVAYIWSYHYIPYHRNRKFLRM